MLLDQNTELKLRATKPKPLMVSILVHLALILIIAFNPDWFDTSKKRVIRIAGEDFDLTKLQLRQLTLPPRTAMRSVPAPPPPAQQQPPAQPPAVQQPQQAAPPPPPPPPPSRPPQPPPPAPERVIRPDDLLAEGARPDGSPRASRGDTPDPARSGGPSPAEVQAMEAAAAAQRAEAQKAIEAQRAQEARQAQIASNAPNRTLPNLNPNTNPNALQIPSNLRNTAGQIVEATLASAARSGRTGTTRGDNNGTFSTEPQILSPNPKGIDFGPYLNRLLTRLRSNWYLVMPEIARLGQRGRVDIVFTVGRTGSVKDLQVVAQSGYDALDKGALSAIELSNPFQQLPAEYETDLKLRIAFLYNMHP